MPIHVAAEGGRAEVVDELLDWCPDLLEAEDLRGHRPLHHASYHGRADVVEVLLRRGAEVSPRRRRGGFGRGEERGERRTTPLHLAARSASLAAVTALLAGGADPAAPASSEDLALLPARPPRLLWLDNAKVVLITCVVVGHSATGFFGRGAFIFGFEPTAPDWFTPAVLSGLALLKPLVVPWAC